MKIYEVVPLAFVIRAIHDDPNFKGIDTRVYFDVEGVLYGEVTLAQFMMDDWEEALLVERPNMLVLSKLLSNVNLVAHAASYELSCLGFVPERFDCTHMLAKLAFFKEDRFDLASVYTYALKYNPYEEAGIDKKVMQKTNWTGQLTDMHYTYGALDVFHMPELWKSLERELDNTNYKLDILTIRHCQVMERRGLPLRPLKKLLTDTIYELNTLESKLPVNPRSSQQVAKYLEMTNGTGADKLAVLISEGGKHAENAQMVRTARELSTYKNTFVSKMVGHSRWYGHFAPRTKSGRLASSNNNLQNLPRKMKQYVGFEPHQDRVLVSADFAQLEMRTVACIANDTHMLELFNAGIDLHGHMATVIFGADYTKVQRQIAKVANFSLLYGAGAAKFAMILLQLTNIVISEGEAMQVKRKWLATFSGVAKWQQTAIKSWRAGNYWFTPMGRKYKAKLMTDFLNIRNQGAGAEVSKLAFNYIMKGLNYEDTYIVDFVHDSYLIDCPNDPKIYEAVAKLLADSMQLAWAEYAKVDSNFGLIRMPVEVGVAYNWADADGLTDECVYTHKVD